MKHKKINIISVDRLEGMTDIHCHLVPTVNDGSRSLERTRQLIEAMRSIDVQYIITIPHIYKRYPHNGSNTLQQELEQLLPKLSDIGVPLILGVEHMLDEGFEAHLGKSLPILRDNKYLLVETSSVGAPLGPYRLIQSVVVPGAIPMLIHPERYLYIDDKAHDRLRGVGRVFQLSLFSLTGIYGEQVQRRVQQLFERRVYSFVGADTHRIELSRRTISSTKTYARYEDTIRALIKSNDTLIATCMQAPSLKTTNST